jgi:EAL domain-containing protein (putative c-di-GMP-specific phosphodiesterase class I)
LRPERLELEITESVLLRDSAETLSALHQLRTLRIGVALDAVSIIRAVVGLGKSLGIKTTSEVVETLEQLRNYSSAAVYPCLSELIERAPPP